MPSDGDEELDDEDDGYLARVLGVAPPETVTGPTTMDLPGGPNTCSAAEAFAELDEEFEDDEDAADDAPEPGESSDTPPLRVVATRVEDGADWDKGLQELQQMIVKRDPLKQFRQSWFQLSRTAQYNEWSAERREAFNQVFNGIVAHPKFIYQMSKFMRGSRGGNCIGNEQIARVCGQVAGFLTVYQLAAAGQ
jgi:hypothetical protein